MGTIKYQEKKLFKPLELAETYGSGIRRAKGLLKDNNSPKLEYAPKDHSSEQTLVKIKVPVSTDSLVFLLEEDETFLSKDTVFNCHQVKTIELNKLNKLNFKKIGLAKNETVDWLRNAVKVSEIVEPEIKKRLKL